jgi:tungstate transport system substrate-binding protein
VNRRSSFRLFAALVAGLLVAGLLDASLPSSSSAAPPTLKIVGTSDVSDSCLLTKPPLPSQCSTTVLHDKILAATGIDVVYTGSATDVAINAAKAGTASLLIVHAAPLENTFVTPPSGPSYSYEAAGRSLMWGDFVLAGWTGDPAGVTAAGGAHDVVAAFHKIALEGLAGNAHFISRSGEPGTTVQEHAIWQLVDQTYHDVPMCTVSSDNGGGMSPGVADPNATDGTCGTSPTYPAWYSSGDRKQADNIRFADTCSVGTTHDDCYVLTDRGTLLNMQSETTPEATHLTTLTRNNAATAPGGVAALVNAFHIYAVNPAAVPSNAGVDTAGAVKVMNYLTSPAGQAAIGGYLPQDPPFKPAASPRLAVSHSVPASVVGSKPITVTGSVANQIPAYPKLAGMRVSLQAGPAAQPRTHATTVATALTDANGAFSLRYTPVASEQYTLVVSGAKRLERADLDPQFFDLLTGTTTNLGITSVNASLTKVTKKHKRRFVTVRGPLNPKVSGSGASLVLYRAKVGHKLRPAVARHLGAGATRYDQRFHFGKGRWKYELVYQNPGVITAVATKVFRVRVH